MYYQPTNPLNRYETRGDQFSNRNKNYRWLRDYWRRFFSKIASQTKARYNFNIGINCNTAGRLNGVKNCRIADCATDGRLSGFFQQDGSSAHTARIAMEIRVVIRRYHMSSTMIEQFKQYPEKHD